MLQHSEARLTPLNLHLIVNAPYEDEDEDEHEDAHVQAHDYAARVCPNGLAAEAIPRARVDQAPRGCSSRAWPCACACTYPSSSSLRARGP